MNRALTFTGPALAVVLGLCASASALPRASVLWSRVDGATGAVVSARVDAKGLQAIARAMRDAGSHLARLAGLTPPMEDSATDRARYITLRGPWRDAALWLADLAQKLTRLAAALQAGTPSAAVAKGVASVNTKFLAQRAKTAAEGVRLAPLTRSAKVRFDHALGAFDSVR